MASVDIQVKTAFSKVPNSRITANHIMLELTGAKPQHDKVRPPLDIIAVVDTSISMSWNNKMENVKRTLELLVKNLSEEDNLTLIEYNSSSKVALKRTKIRDEFKPTIHQAIETLSPHDATNFGAALSMAYTATERVGQNENLIKRIIFFTDGCPTSGITHHDRLIELCHQSPDDWRITTMGYGVDDPSGDDVDLELLAAMAKAGKGNFYYMKDAESTARAFAAELGGLISVVAENIAITVKPYNGRIIIRELLEEVDHEFSGESIKIFVPDLLADETKRLTFAVDCVCQYPPKGDNDKKVADVAIEYLDVPQTRFVSQESEVLLEFVPEGDQSTETNRDVAEQLAVLNAGHAQREAFDKAGEGDFQSAKRIIQMAIEALRDVGAHRALIMANGLEETSKALTDPVTFDRKKTDFTVSMYESSHGRSAGGAFSEDFYTPTLKESVTIFIDDLSELLDLDSEDSSDDDTQEVRGSQINGSGPTQGGPDGHSSKPRVSARQVISDLIAQRDNKQIMKKYGLSVKGLRSLFQKLVKAGLMSEEDFLDRMGPKKPESNEL